MEEGLIPTPNSDKPVFDSASETIRYVRRTPPAHYVCRINSFSMLRESLATRDKDCFQLTEFSAEGYKWVLSVYPRGNREEAGQSDNNHVSIYLELLDQFANGGTVTAKYKFFIYDQIHDNYLAVQGFREKRFRSVMRKWGVSNFISLEVLNDASNGYMIDGCCIFGAEVFVIGDKSEAGVITRALRETCSYTWKIKGFSSLLILTDSPEFTSRGGHKWKLQLYPKGQSGEQHLSVYLSLTNCSYLTSGKKLFAEYGVCIKDPVQTAAQANSKIRAGGAWFDASNKSWGFSSFLPLSRVQDFLVDDVMTVEVNIKGAFLLTDTNNIQ